MAELMTDIRVIRGGSWINYARYCRSAYRDQDGPGIRIDDLGFRVLSHNLDTKRVLRGGYWGALAWWCRSASRNAPGPGPRSRAFGFRVIQAKKP